MRRKAPTAVAHPMLSAPPGVHSGCFAGLFGRRRKANLTSYKSLEHGYTHLTSKSTEPEVKSAQEEVASAHLPYSVQSKPVVNVTACANLLVTAPQHASSAPALPLALPTARADSPVSSISIPSTEKINGCSDDWTSDTAAISAPVYAPLAVCDASEPTPSVIASESAPASTTAQAAAEPGPTTAVPSNASTFVQEPKTEPIDPALEALASALKRLGIGNARLLAQDESERSSVTELVSSYLDLQELAAKPCASGANAATLTSFAHMATLLAVHAGNARLPDALAPLTACLHDAAALVHDDAAPGWLLRGATESHRHETYMALHARLLQAAQAAGLDSMAGSFRLSAPGLCDYHDVSRHLRRALKQFGTGDMSAGVAALLRPRECAEVARLLNLPGDAVLADARHCTEAAAMQATPLERLVTVGGAELEGRLRRVHAAFSVLGNRAAGWAADGGEPLIDSARFFKCLAEAGLLSGTGSTCTPQAVDIIFASTCTRMAAGRRRLAFDGFVAALDALAAHRGDLDLLDVAAAVAAAGGPTLHATSPEPTRLHDDLSGYTGMYAARSSGRGSAEGDEKITLQSMVDRCERSERPMRSALPRRSLAADIAADAGAAVLTPPGLRVSNSMLTPRGASTCGALTPRSSSATPRGGTNAAFAPSSLRLPLHLLAGGQPGASPRLVPTNSLRTARSARPSHISAAAAPSPATTGAATPSSPAAAEAPGLREAFQRFAAFGQGSAEALDGMRWAKLTRECEVLDAKLTPTRADLIFKEVTSKAGVRKLSFRLFLSALCHAAKARGVAPAELARMVAAAAGPLVNGSPAPARTAIAPSVLEATSAESGAQA